MSDVKEINDTREEMYVAFKTKLLQEGIHHIDPNDIGHGMFRRQTTQGVDTLLKSFLKLGGYDPTQFILIRARLSRDKHNKQWTAIDGNHRVKFAIMQKMDKIPCLIISATMEDGSDMPMGVEMLLSWGSNFQHDKGSVHSSPLELLVQMHDLHVNSPTPAEFETALATFLPGLSKNKITSIKTWMNGSLGFSTVWAIYETCLDRFSAEKQPIKASYCNSGDFRNLTEPLQVRFLNEILGGLVNSTVMAKQAALAIPKEADVIKQIDAQLCTPLVAVDANLKQIGEDLKMRLLSFDPKLHTLAFRTGDEGSQKALDVFFKKCKEKTTEKPVSTPSSTVISSTPKTPEVRKSVRLQEIPAASTTTPSTTTTTTTTATVSTPLSTTPAKRGRPTKQQVSTSIATPAPEWLEQYSQLFWSTASNEDLSFSWFPNDAQMIVIFDDVSVGLRKILSSIPSKSNITLLHFVSNAGLNLAFQFASSGSTIGHQFKYDRTLVIHLQNESKSVFSNKGHSKSTHDAHKNDCMFCVVSKIKGSDGVYFNAKDHDDNSTVWNSSMIDTAHSKRVQHLENSLLGTNNKNITVSFRIPVATLASIFSMFYCPTRSSFIVDFTNCGFMSILAGFKSQLPVVAVLLSREYLAHYVMHTFLALYQTIDHTEWKTTVNQMISKKRPSASYVGVSIHWTPEQLTQAESWIAAQTGPKTKGAPTFPFPTTPSTQPVLEDEHPSFLSIEDIPEVPAPTPAPLSVNPTSHDAQALAVSSSESTLHNDEEIAASNTPPSHDQEIAATNTTPPSHDQETAASNTPHYDPVPAPSSSLPTLPPHEPFVPVEEVNAHFPPGDTFPGHNSEEALPSEDINVCIACGDYLHSIEESCQCEWCGSIYHAACSDSSVYCSEDCEDAQKEVEKKKNTPAGKGKRNAKSKPASSKRKATEDKEEAPTKKAKASRKKAGKKN